MGRLIDLTGQRFNRLEVIGFGVIKNKKTYWLCKCNCGKRKLVRSDRLRNGGTQSCACLHKEIVANGTNLSHGMTGTATYISWQAMLKRCRTSSDPRYSDYGGRGIKVCKRWEKFENFYADMGKRPEGKSITL